MQSDRMIETGSQHRAPSRLNILKSPYFLILVSAVIMGWLGENLLLQVVMPWRRPVQNWMMSHGLGIYAARYGLFNLHIPRIVLSLSTGLVIGCFLHSRWLHFSLWYSFSCLLNTWLIMATASFAVFAFGQRVLLITQLWEIFATVPFALAGSWVGARFGKRRYARLHPCNNCKTCGYNLTANVSGRCPECGNWIEPPMNDPATSTMSDPPSKPN
jgi:hypothetical protein